MGKGPGPLTGGDGKATFLIPSKEGPEGGASATLEIDHHPLVNDSRISAGLNAAKLGNGGVDNEEFGFLNGVESPVQGQLDALGGVLANMKLTTDAQGRELDNASSGVSKLEGGLAALDTKVTGLGNDLTNLATSSAGKVNKAGDTMTGPLRLPADGLKVGTNQLAVTAGKVGIGTDTPSAALEVRGDVKLGAAGNLQAAAGEETLRIVRGTILYQNGTLTLVSGSGFTFSKTGTQDITIVFNVPFASSPTVIFSQENGPTGVRLGNVSTTAAVVVNGAFSTVTTGIHFIAIGSR